jgi:integrase
MNSPSRRGRGRESSQRSGEWRPGDPPTISRSSWSGVYLPRIAAAAIGRDDLTAYTLRHSHASALHYAGYTVVEAAARMGHTSSVHLGVYAHVLDLGGERYPDLDALIMAARNPERDQAASGR